MELIKKITDSGYIYMIDYHNQDQHLAKIGVSDNVESRFRSIKSDVPRKARLKLVLKMRVFAPYAKESLIHGWFYRQKTRPRGAGTRAGKTEYFRLSRGDKLKVYIYLWAWSAYYYVVIGILFATITFLIIYFFAGVFS